MNFGYGGGEFGLREVGYGYGAFGCGGDRILVQIIVKFMKWQK